MKRTICTLIFVVVSCASLPTPAEVPIESRGDVSRPEELAEVQGKWIRTMTADGATFKLVKEHKGNKTTVTIFDSEENIITAKKSEFRLENTGKVRIFTFFNNTITAGPQKGQTDNAPKSYIYRIVGDTFVEVNGLLIGDNAEPLAFTWQRLKE